MPERPVHLPGTTLEGGGQLLRNALALSSLARIPIHITSIRGNRSDGGGLKAQHLSGLLWLAQATGAVVEGAVRKSRGVVFRPSAGVRLDFGGLHGERKARIDVGGLGSVFLVFQAVLPVLVFSGCCCEGEGPITLTITGGTTVSHAPSYEYVKQVLLPTLLHIGLPPITLSHATHNPATGLSEVTFTITPLQRGVALSAFEIVERGEVRRVDVTVETRSRDTRGVVVEELCAGLGAMGFPEIKVLDIDSDETPPKTTPNNLNILLTLHTTTERTLASSAFQTLSSKKPPNISTLRHLASHAVKALSREWDSGRCVDQYMQDQLVVFQGLAEGRCKVDAGDNWEGSLHTQTARWVVLKMLGVEWDGRGECEGVGWRGGESWASRKEGEGGEGGQGK
ncbi:MAG: hypothetical protein M1839_001993 [Geoglossum umbratile]|nr:MAG: hypothetical protein M1839_001993 [Geoglossum umbratile]